MNSTTSVTREVSAVNSAVLPFPKSTPFNIGQDELTELDSLRSAAREADAKVQAKTADLLARLQAGATVEHGMFSARIGQDSRRTVPWKAVAERLAKKLGLDGPKYCARVLSSTKPTTKTILKFD